MKGLKKLLLAVKNKKIGVDQAFNRLKSLPYEDLGFAKIDHHRTLRKGFPEVIYCAGKTIPQITKIMQHAAKYQHNVLATRAEPKVFNAIKKKIKKAKYYKQAKLITIGHRLPAEVHRTKAGTPYTVHRKPILIITAGTSDIPVAEEAAITAEFLGSPVERLYDVGVAGIHRLFGNMKMFDKAKAIIVVAGMEGALASVVGGLTDKPVIAVPTSVGYGASFKGLSALLAMLNSCAPGVATVNIDNGFGAGVFASLL